MTARVTHLDLNNYSYGKPYGSITIQANQTSLTHNLSQSDVDELVALAWAIAMRSKKDLLDGLEAIEQPPLLTHEVNQGKVIDDEIPF